MAYLNVGGLIDQSLPQLEAGLGFADLPAGCGADQLNKSLDSLRAFRGLGMSLSAQPDGLQFDAGLAIDRSKLPSEAASAVDSADHENVGPVLRSVGRVWRGRGERSGAARAASSRPLGKCQPDVQNQLDQFGVTGILSNLSGDITVEVGPGATAARPAAR